MPRRITQRHPCSGRRQPWELCDDAAERTHTTPNPAAMVFSDGVFYDPKDRLFKMWYMAGYGGVTCLATSPDGIAWTRPSLDVVPGTNIVSKALRDSSTVWLDLRERDPKRRYKMSLFNDLGLELYTSPDGVHWTRDRTHRLHRRSHDVLLQSVPQASGCFSLRANQYVGSVSGRYRKYWESPEFAAAPKWNGRAPVAWVKADSRDFARPGIADAIGALQSRLRRLRKRHARPVLDLARRVGDCARRSTRSARFQPRRLPLASARAQSVPAGVGCRWQLELGQRAVGRRRLPDRRRPALFLRQRPAGPARQPTRPASAAPAWPRCGATDSRRWTSCPIARRSCASRPARAR